MNPQLEALARRAIASPCWQWIPGMLARKGSDWRRVEVPEDHPFRLDQLQDLEGHIPDPSDPATLGGLLALVRAAFDDPSLCSRFNGLVSERGRGYWIIQSTSAHVTIQVGPGGDSEAEALVACLELAPNRPGSQALS